EYPIIQNRNTDFFLERKDSAQAAAESVAALVQRRLPKYLGVDSLRGIQVMAPMKKGPLGVLQLNAMLQAALNPPGRDKPELTRGECVFRLGDKVMQIRNNYDLEWTRGGETGEGVFNGDIGYIAQLSRADRELVVEFDDGRRAEYDDSMLDELEHSFCISVHKSQGSEFDAVVLPLVSGPPMLMTRNLLYTAVTRARRLAVIVGREDCVRRMVDNNRILHRYSALAQRLRVGA
ncbi:MAG: ATP-dependent RecD-like DNA helicase, partial [Clostridiales bacterium]|nr:ATP-dependent RecD-like DNA helicase [Clostridiales bacterium]